MVVIDQNAARKDCEVGRIVRTYLSNLLLGVPFFFRGGKERLTQILDYSPVASPESGLFSDWSRNKRYLRLSHDWLPVWQCDFR